VSELLVSLGPVAESELVELIHLPEGARMVHLGPETPHDEVVAALREATVVIAPLQKERRITSEMLQQMTRCRFIQAPAVGYDGVDSEAAAALSIPVANLPGFNADAVADWTLMAALNIVRKATWGHNQVEAGGWPVAQLRGRDLAALTVGILGFGRIGQAVGRRFAAFGSTVIFSDENEIRGVEQEQVALGELFERADIVTVHTPLTPATRGLVGEPQLEAMRPGGWLVGAGRGGVIDETALAAALDSGRLAGAALDVFAVEPLPADSSLRGRSDVLLSPHVGGETWEAFHQLRSMLAQNVDGVLAGRAPQWVVNGVAVGDTRP
jgi:D-3-phosphoglycerate dehydrogenase / 2-oxoglutarate reductase